jgi:hypothetical protein
MTRHEALPLEQEVVPLNGSADEAGRMSLRSARLLGVAVVVSVAMNPCPSYGSTAGDSHRRSKWVLSGAAYVDEAAPVAMGLLET